METIKDIVAEMRSRKDLDGMDAVDNFSLDACFGEYGGYDPLLLIKSYADRIEAAHNREMADALDTGAFVAEAQNRKVGVSKMDTTTQKQTVTDCNGLNGAKIREALAAYLALWDNGTMNSINELKRVIKQMREALSAPPRNCDIYNGTGEAMRRYGFPTKSKPWTEADWVKFVDWLFAEAKGENNENK